jgi:hypothetical protein
VLRLCPETRIAIFLEITSPVQASIWAGVLVDPIRARGDNSPARLLAALPLAVHSWAGPASLARVRWAATRFRTTEDSR